MTLVSSVKKNAHRDLHPVIFILTFTIFLISTAFFVSYLNISLTNRTSFFILFTYFYPRIIFFFNAIDIFGAFYFSFPFTNTITFFNSTRLHLIVLLIAFCCHAARLFLRVTWSYHVSFRRTPEERPGPGGEIKFPPFFPPPHRKGQKVLD